MLFSNLFKPARSEELLITKITRPVSFWFVLITFIVLLILNSFNIIHTDNLYLEILKLILLTMVGFYFTARSAEKIAKYKYQSETTIQTANTNNANTTADISKSQSTPDIKNF